MIRDTVAFLVGEGRRVFLDAEHFFDGYRHDAGLRARGGAGRGRGRRRGRRAVRHQRRDAARTRSRTSCTPSAPASGPRVPELGIHCHNDTGCAVANSLAAVDAGAAHVQGTLNGYGERTGNADLLAVVANLEIKLGRQVLPAGRLGEATRIAHAVSEITNVPPYSRQPYVGASAFAHKAGLHASAIKVDPDLYQHTDPTRVGNDMRMLVSDMAGRASHRAQGTRARLRPDGPVGSGSRAADAGHRSRQGPGGGGLDLRGGRRVVRAPPARGGRRRAAGLLRRRELAGDHRVPAGRGRRQRGDREAVRRRPAARRDRRGQRPGQRARPGAAQGAAAGVPGAGEARAHRLPGPDPRRGARHGRRHPRPHRDARTPAAPGRPSAWGRTSSRRPGRRSPTAWSTACCVRASSGADPAAASRPAPGPAPRPRQRRRRRRRPRPRAGGRRPHRANSACICRVAAGSAKG